MGRIYELQTIIGGWKTFQDIHNKEKGQKFKVTYFSKNIQDSPRTMSIEDIDMIVSEWVISAFDCLFQICNAFKLLFLFFFQTQEENFAPMKDNRSYYKPKNEGFILWKIIVCYT